MLQIRWLIVVPLLLVISESQARGGNEARYFTTEEMKIAYQYQEQYGARLRHPLQPVDCLYGKAEFLASFQKEKFLAPCRFIHETVRHLKEILAVQAAKYLFALDASYARLVIPVELWEKKYSKMPVVKILPALLREPSLAAVYHTGQHLRMSDLKAGKDSRDAKAAIENRRVLAFFDGRPIVIPPPRSTALGTGRPAGYESAATSYFLAHRLGELLFLRDEKPIVFDISFDDDLAANIP